MSLDKGLLVGGNVLLDGNRLIARRGAIAAKSGAQLFHIQVQSVRNQRQIVVHVSVLLADQKARALHGVARDGAARLRSVGQARGVAQKGETGARKPLHQSAQDGQSAEAGIEDADGR